MSLLEVPMVHATIVCHILLYTTCKNLQSEILPNFSGDREAESGTYRYVCILNHKDDCFHVRGAPQGTLFSHDIMEVNCCSVSGQCQQWSKSGAALPTRGPGGIFILAAATSVGCDSAQPSLPNSLVKLRWLSSWAELTELRA